jgi:iron complex outermembrane receptor protein
MTRTFDSSASRFLAGIALVQMLATGSPVAAQPVAGIADLSIEDLLKLPVTSVSRREQALSDAPAAVFVVNADDIRRSGATSIPEALRLAPGVQVAQSRSGGWAVTARGSNGRYANKLLVLMDGRVIYSPLFSGVWWEAQGAAMQDIDRIEVIRGPQAALWGANAVNGVINIITRDARDTQASVTLGSTVRGGLSLRHGGSLSEQTHYRLFANGLDRAATVDLSGNALPDTSTSGHVGFRVDSRPNALDRITLIGNMQRARNDDVWNVPGFLPPYNQPLTFRQINEGMNLTGRFDRVKEDGSSWMVQAYVDATSLQGYLGERRHTADIEFQHRFRWGGANDTPCGVETIARRMTISAPTRS